MFSPHRGDGPLRQRPRDHARRRRWYVPFVETCTDERRVAVGARRPSATATRASRLPAGRRARWCRTRRRRPVDHARRLRGRGRGLDAARGRRSVERAWLATASAPSSRPARRSSTSAAAPASPSPRYLIDGRTSGDRRRLREPHARASPARASRPATWLAGRHAGPRPRPPLRRHRRLGQLLPPDPRRASGRWSRPRRATSRPAARCSSPPGRTTARRVGRGRRRAGLPREPLARRPTPALLEAERPRRPRPSSPRIADCAGRTRLAGAAAGAA